MPASPRIALLPVGMRGLLGPAIEDGGGEVVDPPDAEALVWAAPDDPDGLRDALTACPQVRWVQLPWAGIEPYVPVVDTERQWTCAKGVYADPVAEHALALVLAGMRGTAAYARLASWTPAEARNLLGARVLCLGGGGITESLVGLLAPWGCEITVVRRRPGPMDGVRSVLGPDDIDSALDGADVCVLALALTPETDGILGRDQMARLPDHAVLVNVARGRHIVTDDLVDALAAETIGFAGLDVTDPEPLPADHPLWAEPRCLVTPHVGNTPSMAVPLLRRRVAENVRRFAAGRDLLGPVDPVLGY